MKHTETIRGTDVLKIEGLSKAFPGLQALDDVALTVRRGEIHALIGENGAGKSTLMKILAGIHQRDTGTVCLGGKEINPSTPREAQALGISTVHQELSLAPNLTVAENIFVRREPCRLGLIQWRELERRSKGLLDTFGVNIPTSARVGTLSIAMQQVVEIARSLSFEPTVLMLDEPTSSLEDHEVEQLFSVLHDLACDGMSIIYVTHKLKEVFRIADTVTVLRDGKLVATKPTCETDMNDVIRMMVGRDLGEMYPGKGKTRGDEILRVEDLRADGLLDGVSFSLHEGEILGMAGLVGAGRSEISQTIFGHRRRDGGHIYLNGEEANIHSPIDAVARGIAYLPEDRKRQGLFPIMTLTDNIVSANLKKHSNNGFLSNASMAVAARGAVDKLGIRTPSIQQQISLLSGGNQQKALMARWLETDPRVLICDEPTRGIDIGAKAEIHALLRSLSSAGIGIIIISSELPEILGMCDRVLVLHEGRLAGEVAGDEATEEAIMKLATGQAA